MPVNRQVNITVSPELMEALKHEAEKRGVSVSHIGRQAITAFVEWNKTFDPQGMLVAVTSPDVKVQQQSSDSGGRGG